MRGSQTAVFVGLTTVDYIAIAMRAKAARKRSLPYVTFGNASTSRPAGCRILGTQGPAVVVDTAFVVVGDDSSGGESAAAGKRSAIAAGVNLN